MIARHIIVKGKVQGVFFRKYAKQKATDLDICGWVKNMSDGNVEVFIQGDESKLYQFIEWCNEGPPKAAVNDVHVSNVKQQPELKRFSIVY